MWKLWVITVIPFECHVHLNILSFSSAPCFLISSNCPLYKINHFGLTPGGNFILLLKAYRPHRFRIQSTEWDIPGGSFNTVFCGCIKSRSQSHGAQHLFGIYASVVAPKVDLCRPPTVLTRSRSQTCLCMPRITQGREYLMHVLLIIFRYSAIHQARGT